MKDMFSYQTSDFRRLFRCFGLLGSIVLLCASVRPSHAQTAPALQYVPVITTYAGGASKTTLCAAATDAIGDGCPATSSILNGPIGPEADPAGNIYFADSTNNVVRRIDAITGVITVVAGQPVSTASTPVCSSATDAIGDGCPATQSILNSPHAIHFDGVGNMVIVDTTNQVLRVIDKNTGIISLLMGTVGKTSRTVPSNTKPPSPLSVTLDNPWNCAFYPNGDMVVVNSTGDFQTLAVAINGVIDPDNSKVYDLAGNGNASPKPPASNGNGGLATAATFTTSRGLAIDYPGNVYIGDYGNEEVRVISSPIVNGETSPSAILAGTVNDYAGTGTADSSGNGGPAISATLTMPQGLTFDDAGNLYIQEYSAAHDFIRIVNPSTGIINVYAGTGASGFKGDGGPAIEATLTTDMGMKFNLGDRMTVGDSSNARIRTINPAPFFSYQAVGTTSGAQNAVAQATTGVTPTSATVSNTEFTLGKLSGCSLNTGLAAQAYCTLPLTFTPAGPGLRSGTLQVKDSNGNSYNESLQGIGLAPAVAFIGAPITTVTGNGTAGGSVNSGAAASALVNAPRGGAFDGAGNFFFADSGNNVIREITKKGMISVVAGNGSSGFGGDNSPAISAQLNSPTDVAVDGADNLYIADAGNNRIREVNADTGIITTIAGTGQPGYTGDGDLPTKATLNNPGGIAIDNAGTLYVADTGNHALRAFSPLAPGVMTTLAGTGTPGYSGDGGVPKSAELNAPGAVTVDVNGNIYIADTGNAVIRRVTPLTPGIISFRGTISTYAGSAGATANTGDGEPAISAGLFNPKGVGVDAAGNLYIAAGGQVRMVTPTGTIYTVAGSSSSGPYSDENGSATTAVIPSAAQNLAVDQVGNIYLSDTAGNRIVMIAGSSIAPVQFGSQVIKTTSIPRVATVYNSGNQPLSITSIAMPDGYSQAGTGSNECSSTTVLSAGGLCTITISFTPTATADYTAQIVITDNALNNVSSTQSIPLVGTGVEHLNATTTILTYSPVAPSYGQNVTLTATVNGGTNTSGMVQFVVNSSIIVQAPVMNGQATYLLTSLPAGTESITANYLGDASNSGSSGVGSFMVVPAVLTVTADSKTKYPTQENPAFTYAITGFVNNDTAATVISGTPAFSTPATASSVAGSYPINLAQGTLAAPNYTFTFVPGTLTILPSAFAISVNPGNLTIATGQVGTAMVTITPTAGYNGTVNLSCGTLPANVICTFTTPSVLIDPSGPAAIQLTLSTNNFQEVSALDKARGIDKTTLISAAFGLPILSLGALFGGSRRRLFQGLLTLFLFAVMSQGLSGCAPATLLAKPATASVTITGADTAAKINMQATLNFTIQ